MSLFNYHIDFKSMLQAKMPKCNDDFSIQLITGYQGSGKTYFAIYEMERIFKNKTIKTNIHSYHSNNNKIETFEKIEQIYDDDDDGVVYLVDELSKKYTKNSPQDLKFYSWLQQSRKHKRHVYLITQEYIQVPTWLRGIANTVFVTEKVKFLPFFKTTLGIPVLTDEMEWSIQPTATIIYKRTKYISNLYNTFETIDTL